MPAESADPNFSKKVSPPETKKARTNTHTVIRNGRNVLHRPRPLLKCTRARPIRPPANPIRQFPDINRKRNIPAILPTMVKDKTCQINIQCREIRCSEIMA